MLNGSARESEVARLGPNPIARHSAGLGSVHCRRMHREAQSVTRDGSRLGYGSEFGRGKGAAAPELRNGFALPSDARSDDPEEHSDCSGDRRPCRGQYGREGNRHYRPLDHFHSVRVLQKLIQHVASPCGGSRYFAALRVLREMDAPPGTSSRRGRVAAWPQYTISTATS